MMGPKKIYIPPKCVHTVFGPDFYLIPYFFLHSVIRASRASEACAARTV